jgi:hypothetical protein
VVIPEFVVGKWYEHLLHNQSALMLKAKLLFREGTVVTSVPYHVDQVVNGDGAEDGADEHDESAQPEESAQSGSRGSTKR